MNCTEARHLIDHGLQPGSRSTQSAALGFHLAQCAECRDYRQQRNSQPDHPAKAPASVANPASITDKTSHALATPGKPDPNSHSAPTKPVSQTIAPDACPKPTPSRQMRRSRWLTHIPRWLWIACLFVLIGLSVGGLLWVGNVALHVNQDLEAMIISAPAVTPSAGASYALQSDLVPLVPQEQVFVQSDRTPSESPTPWPTLQPPQPGTTLTLPPRPPAPPSAGEAVTLLLLGIDQRPGERTVPRTDTVMLLRADPVERRIALLSLPRDLWVEIPGYGYNRVNSAYVWGEMYQHPGGGLALAHTTVAQLTGIPIDYVFLIDFQAFIALVDNLGGIMVDVTEELYDDQFPTMDFGYTEVHFLPGLQAMNGTTALTYCRIRHPDSDFVRLERQQDVLIGIGTRIRERGDLQNIVMADQFTAALRGYVTTDMPKDRILGLVWALRDMQPDQVERYALDANDITFGVGSDLYAQQVSPAALEQAVGQFMHP